MTVLLRKLAGFSGLVHENMYRFAGWRFLEIGRRLERGIQIAGIVAWCTRKAAPEGSLDMLLEIGDSVMTHRRRYAVSAGVNSYVDLLVLDPLNPRSILFQVSELREQIERLPGGIEDGHLSAAAKAALSLHTDLRVAEPEDMTTREAQPARRRDRQPRRPHRRRLLRLGGRAVLYDVRLELHYDYEAPRCMAIATWCG